MALTTASAVAAMMSSASAQEITDAGVIPRVDALLARWCGYPPASVGAAPTMESTTYTMYTGDPGVYIDSVRARELVLEPYPVTSITSIHDDPNEDYEASELVAASDYVQRGRHGERIRLKRGSTHGAWSQSARSVKAVFTAGFSSVPADLEAAAIEMCAHLMRLMLARGEQSASASNGANVSFRAETIPDSVRELLAGYRLPSVFVP